MAREVNFSIPNIQQVPFETEAAIRARDPLAQALTLGRRLLKDIPEIRRKRAAVKPSAEILSSILQVEPAKLEKVLRGGMEERLFELGKSKLAAESREEIQRRKEALEKSQKEAERTAKTREDQLARANKLRLLASEKRRTDKKRARLLDEQANLLAEGKEPVIEFTEEEKKFLGFIPVKVRKETVKPAGVKRTPEQDPAGIFQ